MAKLLIVDPVEKTRIPFLRGILTRRLLDSGLAFEDAYLVASRVRDDLLRQVGNGAGPSEVTTDQLVTRVVGHLEPFGEEVVQRYQRPAVAGPLMVRHASGRTEPFSRGRQRLNLQASGLGAEQSMRIAEELYEGLVSASVDEISSAELERLTLSRLDEDEDSEAARRYRVWTGFTRSDRPLIVLVGGTPGCGKSTIATRSAHVLDIERTQSTDMLREVMRAMVPKGLVPALHASTFTAWQTLPGAGGSAAGSRDKRVVSGYLTQMELLSLACEAVIQRALKERLSIILEGVHIHPTMVARIPRESGVIVVPILLAVLKRSELKERLEGRGGRITERRSQRYLDNFESIWRMQEFLLSEADAAHIPIIPNEDKDRTVQQVMLSVIHELSRSFQDEPERVLS